MKWNDIFGGMSLLCAAVLAVCAFCSCSPSKPAGKDQFVVSCLNDLTNVSRLAVSPAGCLRMESSFDRTGANMDGHIFNGKKMGETVVLADLKGPGVVRRIWCTGMPEDQKIDFRFDGEKSPRLTKTYAEIRGEGTSPFVPPLCDFANTAGICYLPIPYKKRLLITSVKTSDSPFFFYHINYESLPSSTAVQSYWPGMFDNLSEELSKVRDCWMSTQEGLGQAARFDLGPVKKVLKAGEKAVIADKTGPAVVEEIAITPVFPPGMAVVERNRMLRSVVLRIFWDNSTEPSVEVPMGDFFCNGLRPRAFRSMIMSYENGRYLCRFPMPFRERMKLEMENSGNVPLEISVEARCVTLKAWDGTNRYFHAAWNQSSSPGMPHEILSIGGNGHYAGCYLIAIGMDGSWNILEGDESIYRDGEIFPSFHGTGLEDYFNAGWYYSYGVFSTPFAGALEKSAIRTAQYRFHVPDPVGFDRSLRMNIEFGDRNTARGYMSSVAYWYSSAPVVVPYRVPELARRFHQPDPLEQTTMMAEIFERERISHWDEAMDLCREYMEKYPGTAESEMMGLRIAAYRELMEGYEKVAGEYARFEKEGKDPSVVSQAGMLQWFHGASTNAILVTHINGPHTIYLDGQPVAQGDNVIEAGVVRLGLLPGKHVLAAEVKSARPMPWLSMCLRTHATNLCTDALWKVSATAGSGWVNLDYRADDNWEKVNVGGVFPWMMFFQLKPNAMVFTQSGRQLLGHPRSWQVGQTMFFRRELDVPDAAHSR